MWHKREEIDYEAELNDDQDYQEWSERLRLEAEKQEDSENETTE